MRCGTRRETSNPQISAVSKRFSSSSGNESRMQQKSLSNATRGINKKRSTHAFYSETRVKEDEESGSYHKRYESGKHIISTNDKTTTGLLRMDYHNNQARFHHHNHQMATANG